MTALLDTSAMLLHYFDEPGGDRVQRLIDDADHVLIPSVCITELARRLLGTGHDADEAKSVSLSYASLAERVIPVDTAVAARVFELCSLTTERLPLVDALIAACANVAAATLVHRDPRFRAIPGGLLTRIDL